MKFVDNGKMYDTDKMERIFAVIYEPRPAGYRKFLAEHGEVDPTGPSRKDTFYKAPDGSVVRVREEYMGGRPATAITPGKPFTEFYARIGKPGRPARVCTRAEVEEALDLLWDEPGALDAYAALFGEPQEA